MNAVQPFLAGIKGHRSSIADFMHYCERGELTVMDRAVMLERTRSVAAAAAMHGYSRIGHAAKEMETALLSSVDADTLVPAARAFYDACHEALIMLPGTSLVQPPREGRLLFGQEEKPCLLTADDDRAVRAIITTLFSRHAHVIEAQDGDMAMDAIQLYHPALVLLDDTMPGLKGLTIIEKMHADSELRNIGVIMLTSSDGERDFARAFDAGAVDFVVKPFDPKVLSEKVMGYLNAIRKPA